MKVFQKSKKIRKRSKTKKKTLKKNQLIHFLKSTKSEKAYWENTRVVGEKTNNIEILMRFKMPACQALNKSGCMESPFVLKGLSQSFSISFLLYRPYEPFLDFRGFSDIVYTLLDAIILT